jgi:glutaredoxin
MVMKKHTCPFGLKAKDLLERNGFDVEDHWLETRDQTDCFMQEQNVKTTPQIFIGDERVGGYDALRKYLGKKVIDKDEYNYQPVIAIFSMGLLLSFSISWIFFQTILTINTFEWFISISMCLLAVQKLQNVESFSTLFLNYDLLAKRFVRYGYFYPFGEAIAGILMVSGTLIWIAAPIALIIGTIGAFSVIKAVYIDKRELKCACVGGGSNVPLGFISLTENLMMIFMGVWMMI